MNKKLSTFLKTIRVFAIQNQTKIYSGFGIAGVAATAYNAYKAGPKVNDILKEREKEFQYIRKNDKKKKRELTWKTGKQVSLALAPTIASGIFTSGCILAAEHASSRKIAALSAAYSISETALKELNQKMEDTLGEKKMRGIKEQMSGEKLRNAPSQNESQIILTGDGDVLCMDLYTGRYFRSNAQKIGQAINELSSRVISDMYVSLNEFYEILGIPSVPMGDDLGWNIDDTIKGQLPITFSAQLTNDHTPCLCVEYDATLRADFRKLH